MIQIRQGVFETNSSSTHAISIMPYDHDLCHIPKTMEFSLNGYYGWTYGTLSDRYSKANYLWIAICSLYSDINQELKLIECKDKINNILMSYGVEDVIFDEVPYCKSKYTERVSLYFDGYIDHVYDLNEFVEDILQRPDALISYLFNDNSVVMTGNDNDDTDVEFVPGAEHMYYKGN